MLAYVTLDMLTYVTLHMLTYDTLDMLAYVTFMSHVIFTDSPLRAIHYLILSYGAVNRQ